MWPSKRQLVLSLVVAAIAAVIIAIEQVVPRDVASPSSAAATPSSSPASSDRDAIPEPRAIAAWVNSEPVNFQAQRGKVILVDFWTYSCVNCIRTLPHLKDWNAKYASRGLVIVGIHTPEFNFEKDLDNVRMAIQQYGVTWPVALDNDRATWAAYRNRYWPRKYLADATGKLRYDHIGEGAYLETEEWMRRLLTESGRNVSDIPIGVPESPFDGSTPLTRELYAGLAWNFGGYLGNRPVERDGALALYRDIGQHQDGRIYFHGWWEQRDEFARHARDGDDAPRVAIAYRAATVNAVLRPDSASPVTLRVLLDGKPVPPDLAGSDITHAPGGDSLLTVDTARMYNLIRDSGTSTRELTLVPETPGLVLYTFTFSPT